MQSLKLLRVRIDPANAPVYERPASCTQALRSMICSRAARAPSVRCTWTALARRLRSMRACFLGAHPFCLFTTTGGGLYVIYCGMDESLVGLTIGTGHSHRFNVRKSQKLSKNAYLLHKMMWKKYFHIKFLLHKMQYNIVDEILFAPWWFVLSLSLSSTKGQLHNNFLTGAHLCQVLKLHTIIE